MEFLVTPTRKVIVGLISGNYIAKTSHINHSYNSCIFFLNSVSRMAATTTFVPPAFVSLLKMSLYRLVATGLFPKKLVTQSFWAQLKTKFANAAAYARRLAREEEKKAKVCSII